MQSNQNRKLFFPLLWWKDLLYAFIPCYTLILYYHHMFGLSEFWSFLMDGLY